MASQNETDAKRVTAGGTLTRGWWLTETVDGGERECEYLEREATLLEGRVAWGPFTVNVDALVQRELERRLAKPAK